MNWKHKQRLPDRTHKAGIPTDDCLFLLCPHWYTTTFFTHLKSLTSCLGRQFLCVTPKSKKNNWKSLKLDWKKKNLFNVLWSQRVCRPPDRRLSQLRSRTECSGVLPSTAAVIGWLTWPHNSTWSLLLFLGDSVCVSAWVHGQSLLLSHVVPMHVCTF